MQVSGYTTQEKVEIFRRHISKQSAEEAGLSENFTFSEEAIHAVINCYCRESGVRSMQQLCNNLFYRLCYRKVMEQPYSLQIEADQLEDLVGLPRFVSGRLFAGVPPAGVMLGLAYNATGGTILYIESIRASPSEKGKGQLTVTGRVADVMRESCMIAYTYVRHLLARLRNSFLEDNDVHVNFPEIEIGKDGPSAGVAIASTLLSLTLDKRPPVPVAMTGEINLSGEVRPIGGLKEKLLAAKREGIRKVVVPEDNRRDILKLGDEFMQDLEVKFAAWYGEAYR